MQSVDPQTPASTNSAKLNWLKIIGLSLSLALIISLVFLSLTAGILMLIGWKRYQPELISRNLSLSNLISEVKTGWLHQPSPEQNQQTWLILGVDSLAARGNIPPLTDTILLASIKPQTAEVSLLSLPRDLWFDDVQSKINALYAYGLERDSTQPTQLISQTLTANLDLNIQKTLVVSLSQLESLIDLLDGVQIDIPVGFTDPMFPRSHQDLQTGQNPELLYETVSFATGPQKLTGAMALKYIRSRHSGDAQGTDIARGERQQLVILSLIKQLTDTSVYKRQPTKLLDLWQWYELNFADQISISEMVSLIKPMIVNQQFKPILTPHQLTIAKTDRLTGKILESGVIYNPPVKSNKFLGQWVYLPTDIELLQTEINQKLYQNQL